jgi:ubiquinone biosynthesis protein Coq4
MWNPITLAKLTYAMWNKDHKLDTDHEGEMNAGDIAVAINTVMEFPSNLKVVLKLRQTEKGRDILWGRKDKSEDYQRTVVIPTLTDISMMSKLAPNTIGGHYKHLVNQWSFTELWEKRFSSTTIGSNGARIESNWRDEVRSNISRHVFLCHDFQHVLFRYDTTRMGEMCIQAVTAAMLGHWGPRYTSTVIALKLCYDFKSWEPMRIRKEAFKLATSADASLWLVNPLDMLNKDVEEGRAEFNIGFPTRFAKFVKLHKENFRLDNIHPEYNDVKWEMETV